MANGQKFELRDAICPYVCSTPLDFSEERNYLSRVIFPQLNQLCKSRGSFFNPTDLRWSPGDSNTRKGFMLTTALTSIKKCSPFFICLLGETYGHFREHGSPPLNHYSSLTTTRKSGGSSTLSVGTFGSHRSKAVDRRESRGISGAGSAGGAEGSQALEEGSFRQDKQTGWLEKNFLLAGKGVHPWVLQEGHENSSITELEVTQGVLLCDSLYSTLYYRQSDHLEDKLARAVDTKAQERLLQRFTLETEEAKSKVHDLKQRMVNRGVPVRYFRTVEELGQIVLEDWVDIINTVLPPLQHSVRLLDTLEFKEWQAQQSFIRSRTEVFLACPGVDEAMHALTDFAFGCERAEVKADLLDELLATVSNNTKIRSYSATTPYKKKAAEVEQAKPILVLVGDRGVGKSSMAAKWLTDFKDENSSEAAGIAVISHFVSASNNSTDLINFIKHCIVQLREAYLLSEPHDPLSIRAALETESEAKDQSFLSLCEAFVAALGLGPCVLLLDGVNELTSSRGLSAREAKEFTWLQESLPRTCRVILTTTRSDISYRSLVKRKDVIVLNCPETMTEPQNTLSMVKRHNPLLSQLVNGEGRLQRVSQLKIMSTSLGARVVASEISCHRVYSNLPAFLEDCAEVWSLRDFWIMCVKKWILEYNWTLDTPASENVFVDNGFDFSGWIMDSLCLIAVSRNGLTSTQLLAILEMMGYEGELRVTSYDWLQFRMSAGATLREMEDGRLIFGHRYLQEIAEYLFFKSMASVSYDPAMILKLASSGPRQAYHAMLAQFFSREPLDTQVMEELPWQLMWSGHVAELTDFLTDCGALLKMLGSESSLWQQDLKLYWSVCELRGHHPATLYLQLTQSLGIVDTEDIPTTEERNSSMGSPTEFLHTDQTPRIVVSTPQPHFENHEARNVNGGSFSDRRDKYDTTNCAEESHFSREDAPFLENNDIENSSNKESKKKHQDGHDEKGTPNHEDNQPKETAMFLTQEDTENDTILTSGSADKNFRSHEEEENNFPGVFSLCWQLARFLTALNENEASGLVLTSLIKYIKKNYPLTLEQQLQLCRCHHAIGSLAEAVTDWNRAELEYRQALHALAAAEDMDDELEFVEDTKYLKSLLLSCHGNLRVVWDDQFEAEELLKEALECVEDNPNCLVLKSAIFANLGQLRYVQGNFPRAESCLREATRLRCRWFGRCHSLVADVLVSLAQLLAASGNQKGQDVIQAEHLFRQALTISEKCFGANSLSVASVLFHLGELLAREESHPAKMEAQKLLRRSMDIRTSELGGNHPTSQTTQQSLTRVDVALKMGHYEFGSSRHTDRRSNNLPFSNLTFREDDLNRLQSRMSLIRTDTGEGREQPISIRGVSREEVMRHNRPDSMLSYGGGPGGMSMSSLVSASERLLTAPIGDRPERLLVRRKKEDKANIKGFYSHSSSSLQEPRADAGGDLVIVESLDSKGRRHVVGDNAKNKLASVQHFDDDDQYDHEEPKYKYDNENLNLIPKQESNGQPDASGHYQEEQGLSQDFDHLESFAQNANAETDEEIASQRVQEFVPKKSVMIRPTSGSRRMFKKYSGGISSASELEIQSRSLTNISKPSIASSKSSHRAMSAAKTLSARSRRAWSGRSTASSATSGRFSRSQVPGPHDLAHSARSVGGPNSSLASLLYDSPRPHPSSRPSEHHHRAAWYHVPGRYSTPQERYPRKRMQKTENARDIEAFVALKSQWAKRRQMELQQARLRDLHLEEHSGKQDKTQTEPERTQTKRPKQSTRKAAAAPSKPKANHERNNIFATKSAENRPSLGPTRRLIHPDSTPRLMISGLDMVPEQRYQDRSQSYYTTASNVPAVKFREPIIVG